MADRDGLGELSQERIPDGDYLYLRVHRNHQENGVLTPAAIRDHGDGMSTSWSKYSTPEETWRRARRPEITGVVRMLVAEIREIPGITVAHTPTPDDRSHVDVLGDKRDQEIRVKLLRACREWVVPIPEPLPPSTK